MLYGDQQQHNARRAPASSPEHSRVSFADMPESLCASMRAPTNATLQLALCVQGCKGGRAVLQGPQASYRRTLTCTAASPWLDNCTPPAHNSKCQALDPSSDQTCIFRPLNLLVFEVGSWSQRKATYCAASKGRPSPLATAAHNQPVLAAHDSQPTGSPAKSSPS